MKRKFLLFLAALFTFLCPRNAHAQTYCEPIPYYVYCCSYSMCGSSSSYDPYTMSYVSLNGYGGTSFSYSKNCSDASSTSYGSFFNLTAKDSCQVQQGGTYSGTISITYGYYGTTAVWIDFNNDGSFDLSEEVYFATTATSTYLPTTYSISIPLTASVGRHRMRVRHCYTSSYSVTPPYFDPCAYWVTSPSYIYYYYGNAMDFEVTVVAAPACSGTPTVATTPTGSVTVCAGGSTTLTGSAGIYSGMGLQWQIGTSATGPWSDISGATGYTYTTPAITACKYYRLNDTCRNSGNVGSSNPITVCPGSPAYASVPYFQDFESWQSFCDNSDVPGNNWKNAFASSGNSSWRRDDQGATAGWTYPSITSTLTYYLGGNPYVSGSHSARFHSGGYYYAYPTGGMFDGALDLYLNCSGAGNKLLQFYWQSQWSTSYTPMDYYSQDSLYVYLSTDGGLNFTQLWGNRNNQTAAWPSQRLEIPSTSATTIVRFRGVRQKGMPGTSYYYYGYDYTDVAIDSVYIAPPCNSTPPTPVISPSGSVSACAGSQYTLQAGGLPLAGGYKYTWQASTNGGTSWLNTGDTGYKMNTPNLWTSIQYRVQVTCPYAGSPSVSSAKAITITNAPLYAPSLPYVESFERFQNRCATADAFSPYTAIYSDNTSAPWGGYVSWRRYDKGSTAPWYYGYTYSPYCYSPVSIDSSYSAHVETYYTYSGNSRADLFHFVNCSGSSGNKELDFSFNMPSGSYIPPDTFIVSYSVDSAASFTKLATYMSSGSGWNFQRMVLPTNSPKTVLKFTVLHPLYYSYGSGVGLDNVKVLPACTGKPTAGVFPASVQCANKDFYVTLTGYSAAAGLKFQWQVSPDNSTWVNTSAGDTTPTAKINIPGASYLRVIVTCSNSGQSDTTASKLITMRPFYYCYCDPDTLTSSSSYDYTYYGFTNVAITKQNGDTVLDNGNPLPLCSNPRVYAMYYAGSASGHVPHAGYTNWYTITRLPHRMYLDSLYNFYITLGYFSGCYFYGYPINVYIDFDHNAKFDDADRIFDKNNSTSSTTTPHASDTVRIPHNSKVGLTGMRLLYGYALAGDPLDPCGPPQYHYSEVQDYLVDLEYRPCNGPLLAGVAVSTDTAMCTNYSFMITDTTHEYHQSGIYSFWQSSADGTTYGAMAGTTNRDTVSLIFGTTAWYRMAMVCGASHDTTYSAPVKVSLAAPYKCYCYSASNGGVKYDSSDIGAFTLGKFVVNKKGPHVLNPAATGSHTNYTNVTVHMNRDSTYAAGVYQILRSKTHGDAKVTMFIDYNNNFQYDIPQERVWTGYTSSTDWYITTNITIPHSVIQGAPTGMRLIINNNTAPNVPSDSACGLYTSGETQDYVVFFDPVWPAGVGNIASLQNLDMYPNPTDGKFTVSFSTDQPVNKLQINITNMTGQLVQHREYSNANGHFSTELDMTGQPRGMYFVEFVADGERMIRKLIVN